MERVREQASMRKKVRDHSLKSTWELQLKQARKKSYPTLSFILENLP